MQFIDEQEKLKLIKLWSQYVTAKKTLISAGFIRSYKQPESDLAEWLIARLFEGKIADNKSNPKYDVITDGKRIQVKSVSKASTNPNGYKVNDKDRRNDVNNGATHYAFVFFDNLLPTEIFIVPENFVREFRGRQIKRSNLKEFKVECDLSDFKG